MVLWDHLGDVEQETGQTIAVLDYIWQKYCLVRDCPINTPMELFRIYKWIHLYPRNRWAPFVLGCSRYHFEVVMCRQMHWLARNFHQVHWSDRLSPINHCPHFPYYVTGIVDTFPFRVYQPLDARLRKCLYNPKYGSSVWKWEVVIDLLGRIVSIGGPHIGTAYDAHIFLKNWKTHPVEPWECLLGDGHYTCLRFIIGPYRQPVTGNLTPQQVEANTVISHYRARVEHVNAKIEKHSLFQMKFRGGFRLMSDAVRITLHTTAVWTHLYPPHLPIGSWPHNPEER